MCFLRKGRAKATFLVNNRSSGSRLLSLKEAGSQAVQVPLSLGVFQESKNQTKILGRLEAFVFWCGAWVILTSWPSFASESSSTGFCPILLLWLLM